MPESLSDNFKSIQWHFSYRTSTRLSQPKGAENRGLLVCSGKRSGDSGGGHGERCLADRSSGGGCRKQIGQNDFHTPVFVATLRGVIGNQGAMFAKAHGRNSIG